MIYSTYISDIDFDIKLVQEIEPLCEKLSAFDINNTGVISPKFNSLDMNILTTKGYAIVFVHSSEKVQYLISDHIPQIQSKIREIKLNQIINN